MGGRNRRIRLALVVLLFIIAAVFYTRRTPEIDSYTGFVSEKVVGGGAVLRAGEKEAQQEKDGEERVPGTTSDAVKTAATSTNAYAEEEEPAFTKPPVRQQVPLDDEEDLPHEHGEGRVEIEVPPKQSTSSVIHWTSMEEHFPVTSTIQLPTQTATSFPRIQHTGKNSGKVDAERLAAVKAAAEHAWGGYREVAFGADEVKPISGTVSNPFNG